MILWRIGIGRGARISVMLLSRLTLIDCLSSYVSFLKICSLQVLSHLFSANGKSNLLFSFDVIGSKRGVVTNLSNVNI